MKRFCRYCLEPVREAGGNSGVWIHVDGAGRLCPKSEPVQGKDMRVQHLAKPVDDGIAVIWGEQVQTGV